MLQLKPAKGFPVAEPTAVLNGRIHWSIITFNLWPAQSCDPHLRTQCVFSLRILLKRIDAHHCTGSWFWNVVLSWTIRDWLAVRTILLVKEAVLIDHGTACECCLAMRCRLSNSTSCVTLGGKDGNPAQVLFMRMAELQRGMKLQHSCIQYTKVKTLIAKVNEFKFAGKHRYWRP